MPCDILRYHFLLFYIALHKNIAHKAEETLEKIIDISARLAEDTAKLLTDLQNGDVPLAEVSKAELLKKIAELYKETQIGSISYQLKQICLYIIGCIFGITLGVIGIIPGFIAVVVSIFEKRGTIGWLPLGVFMGGLLGYRLPQKIFQSENDAAMGMALSYINESTQGILSRQKSRQELEKEIKEKLNEWFSPENGIENFLSSPETITCTMKLTPATFMVKRLKKYLGNHLWMEIKTPKTLDPKVEIKEAITPVIELGSPTPIGMFASYTVTREVTPDVLFDMLVEHQLMREQKSVHDIGSWGFWKNYKVGEFDCNAYMDQMFFTTKQKLNDKLPRFDDSSLPDFKNSKWTVSLFFDPLAK